MGGAFHGLATSRFSHFDCVQPCQAARRASVEARHLECQVCERCGQRCDLTGDSPQVLALRPAPAGPRDAPNCQAAAQAPLAASLPKGEAGGITQGCQKCPSNLSGHQRQKQERLTVLRT